MTSPVPKKPPCRMDVGNGYQHGIVVICGEERLHISMCSDNAMMTPDLTTPTRHFWLHLGGSAMQGFQRSQRSIHAS